MRSLLQELTERSTRSSRSIVLISARRAVYAASRPSEPCRLHVHVVAGADAECSSCDVALSVRSQLLHCYFSLPVAHRSSSCFAVCRVSTHRGRPGAQLERLQATPSGRPRCRRGPRYARTSLARLIGSARGVGA